MAKGIDKVKLSAIWVKKNGTNAFTTSSAGSHTQQDKK